MLSLERKSGTVSLEEVGCHEKINIAITLKRGAESKDTRPPPPCPVQAWMVTWDEQERSSKH